MAKSPASCEEKLFLQGRWIKVYSGKSLWVGFLQNAEGVHSVRIIYPYRVFVKSKYKQLHRCRPKRGDQIPIEAEFFSKKEAFRKEGFKALLIRKC